MSYKVNPLYLLLRGPVLPVSAVPPCTHVVALCRSDGVTVKCTNVSSPLLFHQEQRSLPPGVQLPGAPVLDQAFRNLFNIDVPGIAFPPLNMARLPGFPLVSEHPSL